MAGRRHRLQPMVLVDRAVRFVDELEPFILELGGLSYDQKGKRANQIREEVETRALEALRERKAASSPSAAAVRKEPVAFSFEDDEEEDAYYRDALEATEPCLSEVADAPAVTRLSIKTAWPPCSSQRSYPGTAFIAGSHKSLLLLCLGDCFPGSFEPGFYMVYDTQANSVAIVPRISPRDGVYPGAYRSPWSAPCHIARWLGGGTVAIQSRSDGGYLLAELLLCRGGGGQSHTHIRTSKATLFTWISGGVGQWISEEVELPVSSDSFRADMVFAVGPTSLCWVDLLSGVLVYNQTDDDTASGFHSIPLPPKIETGDATKEQQGCPEASRSMCCIDDDTLQFVSIEGFYQDIPVADMMLTTWILKSPRSPTRWQWQLLHSARIGDFWLDPNYNDLPLLPSCPVISTLQPHVIYLKVYNYEYNPKHDLMQATELYLLSLDMCLRGVVSAFKVPCEKNGCAPYLKISTSDFTRYLNQQTSNDLCKVCPRGKEVSDWEDSAWTSVWRVSAPISASSAVQMRSFQDADMSSDSDMSKLFEDTSFLASVLNSSDADSEIKEGMETKEWGGVDTKTDLRCHHGKHPRRLLCWDGNNTGRRYLACPLRGKENRCDFVEWIDAKWPPMFQKVVSSIWEVVGKFKKQADEAQIDLLSEFKLRNDAQVEKEALLVEKVAWTREKEHLINEKERLERELALRTSLPRTTCSTGENRIRSGVYKKMLYGPLLALFGVLVAVLLAVVLKNK